MCELEKETEIEFCVPNKKIFEIYNKIKSSTKIIVTSDMYLPRETILKILNNAGYDSFYKLYLSCELDKKKRNGTLFKYIICDLKTKKILHIGDNVISDYLQAKINGICSKLIQKNSSEDNYRKENSIISRDISYNIISSTANNLISNKNDVEQILGYSLLGPLLLGFCKQLHEYIENNKTDNIFFLARDSKIILDSYKNIYPNDFQNMKYMYISRKSSIVPLISLTKSLNEFNIVIESIVKRKKINDFVSIFGLSNNFYDYLKKYNIDGNKIYDDSSEDNKKIIYTFFKENYFIYSKKQFENLKKYIKNNLKGKNLCIVDIGWKGTIQKNLNILMKDEQVKITGFYYGCYANDSSFKGFLYSGNENIKYEIYNSVGVFETFFINNEEGTTLGYDKIGEDIIPLLDKNNSINNTNNISSKKIQKYAIDYIEMSKKYNEIIESKREIYYKKYHDIIVEPKLSFIKKVKDIEFLDGKKYKLIEKKCTLYYLLHPRNLANDLRDSYYKIGFLKSICKVKMPYNKILMFIYKKIRGE